MSAAVQACDEPTEGLVRQALCTKPADHYGERHEVVWPGLGSYTWGHLDWPDDEPLAPARSARSAGGRS